MLAIEEWMQGKHFLLQIAGPILVTSARDMHEGLETIRERRIGKMDFKLPEHLSHWFNLYRQHHKPYQFLREMIPEFSIFSTDTLQTYDNAMLGAKILSQTPGIKIQLSAEDIANALLVQEQIRSEVLAGIREDIAQKKPDKIKKTAMLSLLDDMDMESSFFFLVTVPCWLLYKMHPTTLYRKARKGNFESLKNLLLLDPLIMHDPRIGIKIQQFRFNRHTNQYLNLIEIPTKERRIFISPQQVKYATGGLLAALAKVGNLKLTIPDIQRLYDAVAKDYDKIDRDPCLSDNHETIRQSIRRYRDDWIKGLVGHKNMKTMSR